MNARMFLVPRMSDYRRCSIGAAISAFIGQPLCLSWLPLTTYFRLLAEEASFRFENPTAGAPSNQATMASTDVDSESLRFTRC